MGKKHKKPKPGGVQPRRFAPQNHFHKQLVKQRRGEPQSTPSDRSVQQAQHTSRES